MLRPLVIALASQSAAGFMVGGAAPARGAQGQVSEVMMASLYDFEATSLAGDSVSMSAYKGKPTLILNVASL